MRKIISNNCFIYQKIDNLERKQILNDEKFEKLFNALEDKYIKEKHGIFYDGQMFDAYSFVSDLIRSSKTKIILIDNYVDDSVLTLFSKNQDVDVIIYTKTITKQLKLDLEKYNSQYKKIEMKKFENSHDRFLILDDKELYHIGSSLKDLCKK